VHHDGYTRLLSDENGNFSTPSFVGFFDTGTVVGEAAAAQVWLRGSFAPLGVENLEFTLEPHQKKDVSNLWESPIWGCCQKSPPQYKYRKLD